MINVRGPIAPPTVCNGLTVPIVAFDQVYLFDVNSLIASIPRPQNVDADQFKATAEELFGRVAQIGDNADATYEHRALNYLSVRYPALYAAVAPDHFTSNAEGQKVKSAPVQYQFNQGGCRGSDRL